MKKIPRYIILFILLLPVSVGAQELYFPPANTAQPWDTVSPASLGWCTQNIAPLYEFLQEKNTKAFIVLKDGRIALEKYFGASSQDELWYWASAGKTLTAFLTGLAQEQGFLSIHDTSSKYLGSGWTGCTAGQEQKITIRHQLTMTTGLNDTVPDNHCTLDTCLRCLAEPGARWAYHNAPYTLLEKVLESATGQTINSYTQSQLRAVTGISGLWLTFGYDNVFYSIPRSMARFGLLVQNNGAWGSSVLLHDTAYLRQMLNTSQPLNLSYGYLWWLNGKASFMMPTLQYVFPGSYAPHAPADMFAGLGKNGQIVSISRSEGIVMVRMGDSPDPSGQEVTAQFCDQVWQKLNDVMCGAGGVDEPSVKTGLQIRPNPADDLFTVEWPGHRFNVEVYTIAGKRFCSRESVFAKTQFDGLKFPNGAYCIHVTAPGRAPMQHVLIICHPN